MIRRENGRRKIVDAPFVEGGTCHGAEECLGDGEERVLPAGLEPSGVESGGDASDNHTGEIVSAGGEGIEEGAGWGVTGDQDYVAGLDISGRLIGVHEFVCVCSAPVERGCCHLTLRTLFGV